MRVACVTTFDAKSVTDFGGHDKHLVQSIEDIVDSMAYIGPLEHTRIHDLMVRSKYRVYVRMLGKKYTPERDKTLFKHYGRHIQRRLASIDADIVFSPMSPGSQPVAYVNCKTPIVIWTDSCFADVVDFYPAFMKDDLCAETYRHGMANERAALERCSMAIYSSEWAAEGAKRHYGIDPEKVKVVPFGANMICNRSVDDVDRIIGARPTDTCKLLFMANNWVRKGGDSVVDIAKRLHEKGIKVQVTMLGGRPSADRDMPGFVNLMGYIDKSSESGRRQLDDIIGDSHFLIMPTTADCTPLSFFDANSFGVPCLSTDVGGIKTVIRDGVNGKTFSLDAPPDEWCEYIETVFSDRCRYEKLARSSFGEYESRLNWKVSARKVKELMQTLL